ncbi:DNA helicase II / ATP-dependent DNA helicase PcrA [Galdieria sulphuraria]|uniref:DNA 3'-5' helicase n=1 Tax=Galdieria sulphuraria TaxID=130081 RepID=M2VWF8_GALSU|nr:DNA helicase II / ATP-dependent DNA helicase PcrA [Galdieria sulphuraria]EME27581.1 DNA helicase II / ATP-dependent DNA helicase PcrA [Galdieria sulphuraria]|eukprot:XP_005704101.1 DNA helicase II / ATP-dependent DNA helicase PcrA [Galdieria sulphuraria]
MKSQLKLTEEQKKAIEWEPRDTLIISSCPGSGKTLVLVYRVVFWIDQLHIPPKDILLITFTRSACAEVRERLKNMLGIQLVENLRVWTFHSLALSVVRSMGETVLKEKFGVSRNFTIFSNAEQRKLLEKILSEVALDENSVQQMDWKAPKVFSNKEVSNILFQIQKHKATLTTPTNGKLGAIFEKYNKYLHHCNGLDFSDLLLCAIQVLEIGRDNDSSLSKIRRRYPYAIVDEYQDCSILNKTFLRSILRDDSHVTLIGDDDQSIYGFQGAEGGPLTPIFSKSEKEENCSILSLSVNFRSDKQIVLCTSNLILRNKYRTPKTVINDSAKEGQIQVWICRNEKCELETLSNNILNLTSNGVANNNIAILVRTRSLAFEIFSYLKNREIPCRLVSEASQSSGDDFEILPRNGQDLCILIVKSFCKLMLNIKDDVALLLITAIYFPNVPQHLLSQWKNSSWESHGLLQELRDACKSSLKGSRSLQLQEKSKLMLVEEYSEEINQVLSLVDTITGKFLKKTRLSILSEEIIDLLPSDVRRRIGDRDLFVSKQIFQKAEMSLEQRMEWSTQQHSEEIQNDSVKKALLALSKNRNHNLFSNNSVFPGKVDNVYTRLKLFVDSLEEVQCEYEMKLQKNNCVQCCTVHQAKGKEWDYVHVVRLNEDHFPLRPRLQTTLTERDVEVHYEEERRIAYVAMSRARRALFLSYLEEEEEGKHLIASRFLTEIPDSLTTRKRVDAVQSVPSKQERQSPTRKITEPPAPQRKRKKQRQR